VPSESSLPAFSFWAARSSISCRCAAAAQCPRLAYSGDIHHRPRHNSTGDCSDEGWGLRLYREAIAEDALLESIERALHWNDRAYEERLERATLQIRAASLTPREREVFELVAAGEPNKVIARHLGISFRTVELHRARIIEKLQARSLSDLIRMAIIINSNPSTSNR
jgi:RNA polymerase sigma factor (sigma-70 family)